MKPFSYKVAIAPPRTDLDNYRAWLIKNGFDWEVLSGSSKNPLDYDALLLTGGADIGKNPLRDVQEKAWIEQCYGKIPIVGICRGMQLMNVYLGGTLHQDITDNEVIHLGTMGELIDGSSFRRSTFHKVEVFNEFQPFKIMVNSRHHQAINEMSTELKLGGISPDGLPEIAFNDFCYLVQWHPERNEVSDTPAETLPLQWLKNYLEAK